LGDRQPWAENPVSPLPVFPQNLKSGTFVLWRDVMEQIKEASVSVHDVAFHFWDKQPEKNMGKV